MASLCVNVNMKEGVGCPKRRSHVRSTTRIETGGVETQGMSDETVTVSAKLPEGLRDRLDEIGEELGISNRSVLVRMALGSFVERQESDCIPPVGSKIEGNERKGTGFEEMFGIQRGNAASSRSEEKDGNRRQDNGRH